MQGTCIHVICVAGKLWNAGVCSCVCVCACVFVRVHLLLLVVVVCVCVCVLLSIECLHVCVRVCNHGIFCRSAAQVFSFTLCQFS